MTPIAANDDLVEFRGVDVVRLLARLEAIVAGDIEDLADRQEAG